MHHQQQCTWLTCSDSRSQLLFAHITACIEGLSSGPSLPLHSVWSCFHFLLPFYWKQCTYSPDFQTKTLMMARNFYTEFPGLSRRRLKLNCTHLRIPTWGVFSVLNARRLFVLAPPVFNFRVPTICVNVCEWVKFLLILWKYHRDLTHCISLEQCSILRRRQKTLKAEDVPQIYFGNITDRQS